MAPAQELVAFAVAVEFQRFVLFDRVTPAGDIDHHGMVDDQIDGHERIDLLRIAAQPRDAVAHGCEIDDGGHAGEILHEDTRRAKRHFACAGAGLCPFGNGACVLDLVAWAIFEAQHVFEQDFEAGRQT